MNLIDLTQQATPGEIQQMLAALGDRIKLAVDVEREVAVGGGGLHFDCEQRLLAQGSRQEAIWGCDWFVDDQTFAPEANINIRPRQGNRDRLIQDADTRARVEKIVRRLLEGVQP